ncbi:MAG: hypothetical protein V3R59_04480 [Gammaproteobacteria bacterium]
MTAESGSKSERLTVADRYWGNIYSPDDRKAITDALLSAARGDKPTSEVLGIALEHIEHIEDIATIYPGLKRAVATFPYVPERKEQLKRLANTAEKFLKAVSEVHPALWRDIDAQADALPERDSYSLRAYATGDEQAKEPTMLLGITPFLPQAARAAIEAMRPPKQGSKQNTAIAEFASGLVPTYEGVTGRKANADYSDTYTEFRGRGGPFVRFVAACLGPIDPDAVSPALGDILHNLLFRRRSRSSK